MTAGPACLRSLRLPPGVGGTRVVWSKTTRITRVVWSKTIRESSMESVWRVDQVFPCRVYIDLNCRDSRI
jgi:hypothetical protein